MAVGMKRRTFIDNQICCRPDEKTRTLKITNQSCVIDQNGLQRQVQVQEGMKGFSEQTTFLN